MLARDAGGLTRVQIWILMCLVWLSATRDVAAMGRHPRPTPPIGDSYHRRRPPSGCRRPGCYTSTMSGGGQGLVRGPRPTANNLPADRLPPLAVGMTTMLREQRFLRWSSQQ